MNDSPLAPAAQAQVVPRPPWGFYGTLGWGAIGFFAWFAAQFAVIIGALAFQDKLEPSSADIQKMASDGFMLALVTIVASPVWVGVSAIAARIRGWRVRDYLALVTPRRRETLFAIGCLVALLISFDLITLAFGREVVPRFMIDAYTSARASGGIVLLFIAIVIVAPVCEELAFRGFLFRGWSESWLGVAGTVVVTSAAWTMMHVQYDWFLLAQVFILGLLFGWLRWASGSALLTIWLHMLANFGAFTQAAIKVEWMS